MYSFDSSAIIHGWRHYPINHDYFYPLWKEWIREEIKRGKFVISEIAFEEIEHKNPELGDWLKEKNIKRLPISTAILERALEIRNLLGIEGKYGKKGVNENDILIIATADIHQTILVTEEGRQLHLPKEKSQYKIPAVCKMLSVKNIDFTEFLNKRRTQKTSITKANKENNVQSIEGLEEVAKKIRQDLKNRDVILLFGYNQTGKTRLSTEFKNIIKNKDKSKNDTLYFNALTEDLFTWDNDSGENEYCLNMKSNSRLFFDSKKYGLEGRVRKYLRGYTDFKFSISYEESKITFSRGEVKNIKISRGEESMFIWFMFLSVTELVLYGEGFYKDIKYIYIDDPVSSLDENNAIAMACDLAKILEERKKKKVKVVISSHHGLFLNVIRNEIKGSKINFKAYFYYRLSGSNTYKLRIQKENKLFCYHLDMLDELQSAIKTGELYYYHFNIMRSILDTTAIFLGFEKFSDCISLKDGEKSDERTHIRALNFLSHGNYPVYSPKEMKGDEKELFETILNNFIRRYQFKTDLIFQDTQETLKQ